MHKHAAHQALGCTAELRRPWGVELALPQRRKLKLRG